MLNFILFCVVFMAWIWTVGFVYTRLAHIFRVRSQKYTNLCEIYWNASMCTREKQCRSDWLFGARDFFFLLKIDMYSKVHHLINESFLWTEQRNTRLERSGHKFASSSHFQKLIKLCKISDACSYAAGLWNFNEAGWGGIWGRTRTSLL